MNKILGIIGVVALVLSLFMHMYSITTEDEAFGVVYDTDTEFPYRDFAFPLAASGLVLLIVGAVVTDSSKKG